MIHVLLEPEEPEDTGWGLIASVVIHAILLGMVLLAYRQQPARRSLVDQFITYLVPPDKPSGQAAAKELRWTPESGGSGTGGSAARAPAQTGTGPVQAEVGDSAAPGESITQFPAAGDTVLTELEVDSAVVRYETSAAPEYPPKLLAAQVEGSVFVEYVVDTSGLADSTSLRILRATHPDFADAIRAALPKMRFRPAMLAGTKVRQLVQQPFSFRIRRPGTDTVPPGRPPADGNIPRFNGGRPDAPD